MEEKGLRYATQRINLQGDPAEPPKQMWYKNLVPSGTVPAVRIRDEIVPESLDILFRLEEEFPEPQLMPPQDVEYAAKLALESGYFNTDSSDWLHNRKPKKEKRLRKEVLDKFQWLERTLAHRGGPFFLGANVSLVDAIFVGFLTRQVHNVLFFKNINLRDSKLHPRLSAWFEAMETRAAYQFTKQDAYFEQRIYQSHPNRRSGAEGCMHLGAPGCLVAEPDCSVQPERPVESLKPGSPAALEATWRIAENCSEVLPLPLPQHISPLILDKVGRRHGDASKTAEAELHLHALASVLVGLTPPDVALSIVGGVAKLQAGVLLDLQDLVATPRDMSSAAAAQLRGALQSMLNAGQITKDLSFFDSKTPNSRCYCEECGTPVLESGLCCRCWLLNDAKANPFTALLSSEGDNWIEHAILFAKDHPPNLLELLSTNLVTNENSFLSDVISIFFDSQSSRCIAIAQALLVTFPEFCRFVDVNDKVAVAQLVSSRAESLCRERGVSALLPSGILISSCEWQSKVLLYELRYRKAVSLPSPAALVVLETEYWVPLRRLHEAGTNKPWWWCEDCTIALIARALHDQKMCVIDSFLPDVEFKSLLDAARAVDQLGNLEQGLVQQRRNGSLYFKVSSLRLEEDAADLFNRDGKPNQWAMFKDEMAYFGDDDAWDILTRATDNIVSQLRCYPGDGNDACRRYVSNRLRDASFREEMQVACFRKVTNGRYQQHIDTDGGSWRVLTAILYLNRSWKTEEGGELRMFMPGANSTEVKVDTLPAPNRLVLFWSNQDCPHEVLCTRSDRWAATVWYSSASKVLADHMGGADRLNALGADSDLPPSVISMVQKFLPAAPRLFSEGFEEAGLLVQPAKRIAELSAFVRTQRNSCSKSKFKEIIRWISSHGGRIPCLEKGLKRKRSSSSSSS